MKTTTDLLLNPIKEKISKSPLFSKFLDADLDDLDFFNCDDGFIFREDLADAGVEKLWGWLYEIKKQYFSGYVVKYILKCKIKEDLVYEDYLFDEWKIEGKTATEFWEDHVDQIYNYVNFVYSESKNLGDLDDILEWEG
mgnify:CR=1 FL=1